MSIDILLGPFCIWSEVKFHSFHFSPIFHINQSGNIERIITSLVITNKIIWFIPFQRLSINVTIRFLFRITRYG